MFHLGWFLYEAVQGWGTPEYDASYGWATPKLHQDMARRLEAAGFDFILLEDSSAIPNEYAGSRDIYLSETVHAPKFDPPVMASYMAAATSRIGIVPTMATTFYPPFILARQAQTLDLMSGGRLGWNIVTSSSDLAARNFGQAALPEHDERYDVADEYLDVCKRLWSSWEPGAVLADIESGVFADHTKVREIDHRGAHYSVLGPLNVPPSPQGRPVLAQAGNSPRGRRFAAQHADIVLTPVNHPDGIKAFRDDIRRLAVEAGRNPDDVKVMALAFPRICEDQAAVADYRAYLKAVPDRLTRAWVAQVSAITGLDLSRYELDEPLPDSVQTNGSRGTLDWLRRDRATVRQIGLRLARLTPEEPMIGTAEQIAAEMAEVMAYVGGDGFLISGPLTPRNVARVADQLVPALQKLGVTREAYSHETLRGNLLAF
ncbi:NtaA/DmoA family FMN-dependent monooxygenase [Phenylobacterium sp. LjRoot225]|uniref:NtaA/DmoA family FMN-dependent monooxygenase n=1 Tax=Phenylobacterium sp. LjRoot225 TaxID=3342285 RepID=UPI003ED10272